MHRAGAQDRVIVKTFAGVASVPLAAIAPYDRVPFAPILITADPDAVDVPRIIDQQMRGAVKPIAVELPVLPVTTLPSVLRRAKALGRPGMDQHAVPRLRHRHGGDPEARRDPAAVWGRLADMGVRLFQTDAVETLLDYRARRARDRHEVTRALGPAVQGAFGSVGARIAPVRF
ncbi:Uncharacterised protein [Sphingomonas paucimobilis]|nr:Uncharacterised protein [Sphingomonas paucimobilis]